MSGQSPNGSTRRPGVGRGQDPACSGFIDELHRLAEGVFALSDLFVANRLPETVSGLPRDARHPHPGIYPESCEPQGWSSSMVIMLAQSLPRMWAIAPQRLLIIDPKLPPRLPDLRLEGLRLGRARLDLEVWRDRRGETRWRVRNREGRVRVVQQPPPESPEATLLKRVTMGAASFFRG